MNREKRGTRRAGSLALITCAALICAAETGGAVAPPCAHATPLLMIGPSPIKPAGDPDTPDEGIHKASATTAGGTVSPIGAVTSSSFESSSLIPAPFARFARWIRSILGNFIEG